MAIDGNRWQSVSCDQLNVALSLVTHTLFKIFKCAPLVSQVSAENWQWQRLSSPGQQGEEIKVCKSQRKQLNKAIE